MPGKTNKKAKSIPIGSVYTWWTVVGCSERWDYLKCVCVCGQKKDVNVYSLTSGKSRSCGCASAQLMRQTIERRNPSD